MLDDDDGVLVRAHREAAREGRVRLLEQEHVRRHDQVERARGRYSYGMSLSLSRLGRAIGGYAGAGTAGSLRLGAEALASLAAVVTAPLPSQLRGRPVACRGRGEG